MAIVGGSVVAGKPIVENFLANDMMASALF
jgi:hypothetical protein